MTCAFGIGGGGFVGLAIETTPGTYVAPTKFFPILSESLQYMQATNWRRPIRQNVDVLGAVPGDVHIEGDIEMEVLTDAAVYFHLISRATVVKSGTAAPWSYVFTPSSAACAGKTASITVVRNGVVFGYTGCVVPSFTYTIEDGMLKATYSILGRDEASQSLPVPTFAGQERPFGAGEYSVEIPTASQIFDADTFEWSVNDNGTPQFRMKNTGRGAQFIQFGERETTLTVERDFSTRVDYDAFKALTAQSITIDADLATSTEKFTLLLDAAIKDTYELGLSGQGDLIRAAIEYQNTFNPGTSRAYRLTLLADEDITVT